VEIDVGTKASDIYDAVTDELIQKGVRDQSHFIVPADTARIIVLAPAERELRHDGKRTLIDDVVVRWAE
jgi:hypothetical protein